MEQREYITSESKRAYQKKYYQRNKEKMKEYAKKNYQKNREKRLEQIKHYSMTHDRTEYFREYRARMKGEKT